MCRLNSASLFIRLHGTCNDDVNVKVSLDSNGKKSSFMRYVLYFVISLSRSAVVI